MRRRDRRAWAAARDLPGLGLLVTRWLAGEIRETPSHCGRPDPETARIAPVLAAVNRAGMVTENSQPASLPAEAALAGCPWNAWVALYAGDAALAALRRAAEGSPVEIRTACRGGVHSGHDGDRRGCPRTSLDGFWGERAPHARAAVGLAWYVLLADPEPGRDDRLWPLLAGVAAGLC